MKHTAVFRTSLLLGIYIAASLLAGCVVAGPREGYYDRPHGRWYHHHAWVVCTPREYHCR